MKIDDNCVIGTTDSTVSFSYLTKMLNLDSELKFPVDVPVIVIQDDMAYSYFASIIAVTHILAMHYGFEDMKDIFDDDNQRNIYDQLPDSMKHNILCSHVMVECALKNGKKALPNENTLIEIIKRLPEDLMNELMYCNINNEFIMRNVNKGHVIIGYLILIKTFATYYKWEKWEATE